MASETGALVLGTRKSQLAMTQTMGIHTQLQALYPGLTLSVESMETLGDKVLDVALSKVGEKSLFTKELEGELLDGRVHLVVHSLKDLPTTLPPGLVIAAMCEREDPRDAVLFHPSLPAGTSLAALPAGSVVGTSSLRRVAQLAVAYPHLAFETVRGNLNTRLAKLEASDPAARDVPGKCFSALCLAAAGVIRMGWREKIGQLLNDDTCLHAVGQGSVAIECRADDERTLRLVRALQHMPTALRCEAERAFMRHLEGGCSVPLGVHTVFDEHTHVLSITGGVFSLNGAEKAKATVSGVAHTAEDAVALGVQLAGLLREQGAMEILRSARAAHEALP